MSLSRDEAREVAAIAIALVIGLRILAGVFQALDELGGAFDARSLLGRFLAPVGSTLGILTLALALLVVLSPNGSIERRTYVTAQRIAAVVSILGVLSVLNSLVFGFGGFVGRVWFTSINGFAALLLGSAAWWILTQFDGDR